MEGLLRPASNPQTMIGVFMSVLVGKKAPVFTSQAVLPSGSISETFDFGEAIAGKYAALFFYPLDFTFVCPSEIIAFANRTSALHDLGCVVVAVSVDSHHTHVAYRNTPIDKGGIGNVPFVLVSDMTREISAKYGILAESSDSYYPLGVAMRATFLIDKSGIVRHQVVNDEPLGRNVDDLIRTVDALQFFEEHGQVCPAGWKKGDAGMINTPQGVASYLTENAKSL